MTKDLVGPEQHKVISFLHNLYYFTLLLFQSSGLLKVIFLAVAEAKGEGGKTSALEVEAEGEAEGSVVCILVLIGCANSDIGF